MNQTTLRVALIAPLAALSLTAAPVMADPIPTPSTCSQSQGVRISMLAGGDVDLSPVPSRYVTDENIRQGLRAAGVAPRAEGRIFAAVVKALGPDRDPNVVVDPQGISNASPRGVMQLSRQTFAENHVVGTSNKIKDPISSVAAGITYASMAYCIDLGTGAGAEQLPEVMRNPWDSKEWGKPLPGPARTAQP